jgi:pyruvate/2-oxoglutarate dehydrogenase complex dihydrolipoamide dehydrogenase (E3) component
MQPDYEIVVIGGGPAGFTAAMHARSLGANVALVERGRMGGTCTNDGCVPTRVLAKAARLLRDTEQFDLYGLEGELPRLDFARLMTRTQQVVYGIHEKKQIIDHLRQAGVTVFNQVGLASFVDPHTIVLQDERHIRGSKFILCAGGRARRVDFPGAEHALTHSDIWSLNKLPASIAVVGAAATGCQLASILATFGSRVHLLEVAPRILRMEDECISETIQASFEAHGIEILAGIGGISFIEREGGELIVNYQRDQATAQLRVEAVLMSTGWVGNLSALNLPAAGVETTGNYVKVDDQFCTTAAHIFAAGDITGKMMLVQSAGYEALAAAENAVLGACQVQSHDIVPHGGFTDPEYGSVGLTELQARQAGAVAVATVPYAEMDRAVIDGRPEGLCKLIVSLDSRTIVGAHVAGEQALEIVEVAAAGMASGMTVDQLANLEIAYPTFTAVLGVAARRIVREVDSSRIVPQWRSLEKHFASEWEHRD